MARFEVMQDDHGGWQWQLVASTGERIAAAAHSLASRDAATQAVEAVKVYAAVADVAYLPESA